MTAVCPGGHVSATTDYCDQCGARIGSGAMPIQPTEVLSAIDEVDTSPAARQQPCPACGATRPGGDRYCEGCGHDFVTPHAGVEVQADTVADREEAELTVAWEALATADQRQFERNASTGIAFPSEYGERRFALEHAEVRIGRSRGRPGEQIPEIDLAGEPEDPGISHLHAVLQRQDDGSYALRDLGSTNGTIVNDDPRPIDAHVAVPLVDRDRVRVGAWTTITLRRR
jgi:FHA domain